MLTEGGGWWSNDLLQDVQEMSGPKQGMVEEPKMEPEAPEKKDDVPRYPVEDDGPVVCDESGPLEYLVEDDEHGLDMVDHENGRMDIMKQRRWGDLWNGGGCVLGSSNTEKEVGEEQRRRLLKELNKPRQGTITHFLSKPIKFRDKPDGDYGGGMFRNGMEGMGDGSRMEEPCVTTGDDLKTKLSKRKRGGAKSKSGKNNGSQGSDSSQRNIKNYLICRERPVEVGISLGIPLRNTNTS